MSDPRPELSVVIPALDEAPCIEACLDALRGWSATEVVLAVDDRCSDATAERAESRAGVRVLRDAGAGRGAALARGVDEARAPLILLLHADSRVDEASVRAASRLLDASTAAVAFRMRIDSTRRIFRLLERGVDLRSRILGLPYGDQGLLVRADVLARAGGIRPLARCEDLDLVLRLRRLGRVRLARGVCVTSARRWEREGTARVTFANLRTLFAYFVSGGPVLHGHDASH